MKQKLLIPILSKMARHFDYELLEADGGARLKEVETPAEVAVLLTRRMNRARYQFT